MSGHNSIFVAESDLPVEISLKHAVEAAYSGPLAEVASQLRRELPALVECDKELTPFAFDNLRERLKPMGLQCVYLDGRPKEQDEAAGPSSGFVGSMLTQFARRPRGRRKTGRRSPTPGFTDHQPGDADYRGTRGHPSAV